MINQDLTHQVGRYTVELRPILTIRRTAREAKKSFMHQSSRLQRMPGRFAPYITRRQTPQFFVNQWRQRIES
jgi:hypothetical protein